MSFPRGYRVFVDVRRASLTELEAIARTSVNETIRDNPAFHAQLWKDMGIPSVLTAAEPSSIYTGWVLTPSNDVEFYDLGVRRLTKHNYYEARYPHAYGLDGEALEERRH